MSYDEVTTVPRDHDSDDHMSSLVAEIEGRLDTTASNAARATHQAGGQAPGRYSCQRSSTGSSRGLTPGIAGNRTFRRQGSKRNTAKASLVGPSFQGGSSAGS